MNQHIEAPSRRGLLGVHANAGQGDVLKIVQELNAAFEAFKRENDSREENIKKGVVDALQETTLKNMEDHISELQAAVDAANQAIASQRLFGGNGNAVADAEYTLAFKAHMRAGDIQAALNKGSAEEGGYLAPTEWDRTLTDRLIVLSPMRSIATVQRTSKGAFTKLFAERGMTSGWVGETDARPNTATDKFKPLTFTTGEIYVNPSATQSMLDDNEIDLENWLMSSIEDEIALQEGSAFISGDGVNKPYGLLTYVEGGTNAARHPYGAIKTVASGAANTITSDSIIDLIYSLPSAYTGNARFVVNRNTLGAIRKLKDGNGNYLWQPSFAVGQPSVLLNYPVTEMADMLDVAANAVPMVFGDFKQGYLVLDRMGVRILRDPYTNKPYISFYTTKRVGGGVANPDVFKALKVSA